MSNSEAVQKYEIYINDSLLTLCGSQGVKPDMTVYDNAVQLRYFGQVKTLLNVIDNLEKSTQPRQIFVVADVLGELLHDFTSLFKWIEAAGGIVENGHGEVLSIFRRKHWDLPKGKLDPGETFEEAAVREVIEETGLESVERHELVTTSLHCFRNRRNERSLKLTKWFRMTTESRRLKVQTEEDIEKAEWMPPEELMDTDRIVYQSIRRVVQQYLNV